MNTLLKNFWLILRRCKTASFLNIAGLAVAFASFLVIIMQVEYEWTFDTWHTQSDRIFRIDMPGQAEEQYSMILPQGYIDEVLASSPHIERGSLINLPVGNLYFTVGEGSAEKGFYELFYTCYPDLVHIFDLL